jgi:tetratricopeptide (TPR) repeat protein
VREFRDRAFHAVARNHFDRWGGSHALALHAVLREHLVRWVNGSFGDSGLILRMSDEPGWEAPAHAAIFLDSAERRDLLRMATEELPLPEVPDWTREADVAALRARVLLAWTDEVDHLYGEVRAMARELESVSWTEVPVSVLARRVREILASDWERAGALSAALVLFTEALSYARRACEQLETPDRLRDVSVSLDNVGNILESRGDTSSALERFEESLGIRQRLLADAETPGALNNLLWTEQLCAGSEISLSRPDAALVRLESFVEQASILDSAKDANTLDTAATYWERRTEALEALGWASEAAESRARALVIRTRIAQMESE